MAAPFNASLSEGLQRQKASCDALLQSGAGRLGWKAGFGTPAALEKLGTTGPLVGRLTDSTLRPSGTLTDVSGWGKPVLEPEVALRLSADVAAGQSRTEIESAVDAVAAAIELVDLGGVGDHAGDILAANVFHRAVLLGDFTPVSADAPLSHVRIDVRAGGTDQAVGADPAVVLGDLVDVVAGMADLLAGSEDGLRGGDVIITGAAVKPLELSGGEQVEVRVGGSEVSVRIG